MSSPDRRSSQTRPTREQYFMLLAVATRERAACLGRHVGAILVADQRIIATGYNGTPTGFPNCDEGGCHRCANPESYAEGRGYDVCICVHAEQNALLQAAKIGY
jgi:dCMP deaminase